MVKPKIKPENESTSKVDSKKKFSFFNKKEKGENNVSSIKDKKEEKKALKTFVFPLAFTILIVSGLYLAMANKTASADEMANVVYARKDISANTYISSEDVSKYFCVIPTNKDLIAKPAMLSLDKFPSDGFYVESDLKARQTVYKDDFSTIDKTMEKYSYKDVTTTSIAVDSFDNSVNGSIRTGDIVDVYAMNPVTETLELMAEDVYIVKAYDKSGASVSKASDISVSYTILVAPEEIGNINTAITYGGIQLYLTEE